MTATTTPAIEQAEIERHPEGERWLGMEVAAWRAPVRKPADCSQEKWDGVFPTGAGNTYAEHWSTPGSHEWDEDKVERLFLQADVAALLARQRQAFEAREARLREANDTLLWLSNQRRLSLDFYSPVYGDDDDQSTEWRVHRETGPINDREWEIVGRGANPLDALLAARAALGDGK